MRLVEFTKGGDKVSINPKEVAQVIEEGPTKTKIRLVNEENETVDEAYADVIAKLLN